MPSHSQSLSDVKYFDLEDGLQESSVLNVVRDNYGFFYLATPNHIQQFDGQNFSEVELSPLSNDRVGVDQLRELKSFKNFIYLLFNTKQKSLYRIPAGSQQIEKFDLHHEEANYFIDDTFIYAIENAKDDAIDDSKDNVLDDSKDDGIDRTLFIYDNNKVLLDKIAVSDGRKLVNILHRENLLFIEWEGGELSILNRDNSRMQHCIEEGKILKTKDDEILVFTSSNIYEYKDSAFEILIKREDNNQKCVLLEEDKFGNILAGYSSKLRHVESYHLVDRKTQQLGLFEIISDVSLIVTDVYAENFNKDILVSSYKGMYSIRMQEDIVETLFVRTDMGEGKFGHIISGLAVDNEGFIHGVKEEYDYFLIDSMSRMHNPLRSYYDKGYFYNNSTLVHDKYSNTVYGSSYFAEQNRSQLYSYNPNINSVAFYDIPFKIYDKKPSRDSTIYLAGGYLDQSGLFGIYDLKTKKFRKLVGRDRLADKNIRSFLVDDESKAILLGTENGLLILDENYNEIARLDKNAESNSSYLSYDHIRIIKKYNGQYWVGTSGGGLYILNEDYILIDQLNMSTGLSNDNVIGIIKDDLDNYWISTFNGLNVVDSNFNLIKKFYLEDGLSDKEFNTQVVAKDKRGNLYFGTLNGITKVNPKDALEEKVSCGIYLDELVAKSSDKSEIFYSANHKYNLQGNKKSLSLYFKFPDYRKPAFGNYLHSLNIATEASSIKKKIFEDRIELTNLPAEKFTVKISNNDYFESINLEFDNSRDYLPFIKYLAFALAVLTLAYLLSKYFINKNRKKEKEKTQLNRRISEMQLSSLQSQMNPHFIFNALGAIQYFIQTNETDKADEYLSDFAKLIRSILESSKSRYISLRDELEMLEIYVSLEQVRFEDQFDYVFHIDENIDLESMIPPMMIQPFIENAINHGLVSLQSRKGLLAIYFEQVDQRKIRCRVRDNGVGRHSASKMRLKKHKSRGMEIVNDRIATINASNILKLDLQIVDLIEAGLPVGTEVILEIEEQ